MALSSDATRFTLKDARDALRAKKISARELAEAHIARAERGGGAGCGIGGGVGMRGQRGGH